MKLRNLVAGLAFIGASAGAFALTTSTYENVHDIGVVSSPRNFIIDNTVTTSTFDDFVTFGVDPTSYASNVFFSQLSLGNLQHIAEATLSLWDVTSGSVFLGSVPLDEPPFTSTATFFSGHTYALEVSGTRCLWHFGYIDSGTRTRNLCPDGSGCGRSGCSTCSSPQTG